MKIIYLLFKKLLKLNDYMYFERIHSFFIFSFPAMVEVCMSPSGSTHFSSKTLFMPATMWGGTASGSSKSLDYSLILQYSFCGCWWSEKNGGEQREKFVVGSIVECRHWKHWMNNQNQHSKKVSYKIIVYNSWKDESFSFEIPMFEDLSPSPWCFFFILKFKFPESRVELRWVQTWLDVWNTSGSSPPYPR